MNGQAHSGSNGGASAAELEDIDEETLNSGAEG
jgi:hypothetical protein